MYGQICFTLGFFWFAVLNLPGSLVEIGFFHVFLFWMFFCEYLEGLSSSFLWLCCKFKVAFVSCTVYSRYIISERNAECDPTFCFVGGRTDK